MLKVVKPNVDLIEGTIHDDFIVEREAKSGQTVFGIMFQEKNLSLSAGFGGGKKTAFYTTGTLEDMQEAVQEHGIKINTPVKGWKIVYKETVEPPQGDPSYSTVPIVFVDDDGNKTIQEGVNVTSEGSEIYRQSRIVPTQSGEQDILLPHDKRNSESISEADLAAAAENTRTA